MMNFQNDRIRYRILRDDVATGTEARLQGFMMLLFLNLDKGIATSSS